MHILIVDDSAMVRKMTSKIIASLGYSSHEVCDGMEAVEIVKEGLQKGIMFDIILMDNQMPNMLGVEATKIIRHELKYSGFILGITGNALEEDLQQFRDNEADEVLIKPLTRENFQSVLNKYRTKLIEDLTRRASKKAESFR
jgi:osomolarity two-component system sensor histidine kinase SLN1